MFPRNKMMYRYTKIEIPLIKLEITENFVFSRIGKRILFIKQIKAVIIAQVVGIQKAWKYKFKNIIRTIKIPFRKASFFESEK
jgi:hypothetical protein